MKQLAALQDQFQQALLEQDDTVLSTIPDAANGESNEARLGIYRYAYLARLQEILSIDHERLHSYLGDEQFAQLTETYLKANPSHFRNARWIGEAMPAFLADTAPWRDRREIRELSALEHALNQVFDEADEPVVAIEQLAAIAPEDWPDLGFTPIRATRRLGFQTNAADIWSQLREEQEPPEVTMLDEPQQLLVYRSDEQSFFRHLPGEEAMMWDEMAKGVSFGVLCEMVATFGGEDDAALRAACYLQGWIMAGLLAQSD